ncbi:MAG: methyltransferase domain-containing protein [Acidimicrobiales bacterium]
MATGDEIRDRQRATWAGLSTSWEKWDGVIVDQLAPVGTAMVDALGVGGDDGPPGGRLHLDVASGTGEPGLTIARAAPDARVVLTDLSPEMLAVASRRAEAAGVTNVETQVCSADDLPFDDDTFSTISVRFGFMFFPDLDPATAELVRVLAPGGRLCSAVWIDPDQNPWTAIAMQAIATEVEVPSPEPDAPSMFRCAAPGAVRDRFESAGLRDVREWDVDVELVTRSADEYWDVMSEHVSLIAAALRQVDEPTRERIRAVAVAAVAPFANGDDVRVPGLARCTVGTKPGGG